jgi:hypothetical protein
MRILVVDDDALLAASLRRALAYVPGSPEPFGDLDETWKRAYLQAVATRP